MRLSAKLEPWSERHARELFGEQPLENVLTEVADGEECFFVASSAGMVFGLVLHDGSKVAVKVFRPRPGLKEASEIHAELRERGFPCPRPLRGPVRRGNGYAVVHEWIEAPQHDLRDPMRRQAAVKLLAELIALAPTRKGLPPTFTGTVAGSPFPRPHDSRFDFARAEGRWIDKAAAVALASRARPNEGGVVGHSDWVAKHFGWEGDRIAVVYDWPDSVALDAEETIVGQASVNFTATWDLPVFPKFATREESEAFVEEYEELVGRRLDRGHVAAAQLYLPAYSARCELSELNGDFGEVQQRLLEALA